MKLYVFQLSHFCEKGRWALDHTGIDYRLVSLLPGPHLLQVRRFAPGTSVPVIVDGATVVQGSDRIIDYVDSRRAENPLTPELPKDQQLAREWEARFDRELGVTVRRVVYFHGLPHASFIVSMFTSGAPSWARAFYRAGGYALVSRAIRRAYEVTEANVVADLDQVRRTFDDVERELETRPYLVGERFSRADLTLAALAAPFFLPDGHPFRFPVLDVFPPALVSIIRELAERPIAGVVRRLYRDHRSAVPTEARRTAPRAGSALSNPA